MIILYNTRTKNNGIVAAIVVVFIKFETTLTETKLRSLLNFLLLKEYKIFVVVVFVDII